MTPSGCRPENALGDLRIAEAYFNDAIIGGRAIADQQAPRAVADQECALLEANRPAGGDDQDQIIGIAPNPWQGGGTGSGTGRIKPVGNGVFKPRQRPEDVNA